MALQYFTEMYKIIYLFPHEIWFWGDAPTYLLSSEYYSSRESTQVGKLAFRHPDLQPSSLRGDNIEQFLDFIKRFFFDTKDQSQGSITSSTCAWFQPRNIVRVWLSNAAGNSCGTC